MCAGILGINNALEVLLLMAEIFLWSAGLGNSILKRKTGIFAVIEWCGLTCFFVGFVYCAKEILKLYFWTRCKRKPEVDLSEESVAAENHLQAGVELSLSVRATNSEKSAQTTNDRAHSVQNPLRVAPDDNVGRTI